MSTCNCQTKKYQEFEINDEFYHSLSPIHIVRTLMEEHQVILNFCDELEKNVDRIKKKQSLNDSQNILTELRFLSSHLLRTEKHHIREELTIISRLVALSLIDPSHKIKEQHRELWVLKRKLEQAVLGIHTTIYYSQFLKNLQLVSNQLIGMLRDHIKLENNILFPQAAKMIPDKDIWHEMRRESYNIGYCCFTPK